MHLLNAHDSNFRFDCLQQWTGVANILPQGKALAVLAQYLVGATLIGHPIKNNRDLRPAAIREATRRLVSKYLRENPTTNVKRYMFLLQLGIRIN